MPVQTNLLQIEILVFRLSMCLNLDIYKTIFKVLCGCQLLMLLQELRLKADWSCAVSLSDFWENRLEVLDLWPCEEMSPVFKKFQVDVLDQRFQVVFLLQWLRVKQSMCLYRLQTLINCAYTYFAWLIKVLQYLKKRPFLEKRQIQRLICLLLVRKHAGLVFNSLPEKPVCRIQKLKRVVWRCLVNNWLKFSRLQTVKHRLLSVVVQTLDAWAVINWLVEPLMLRFCTKQTTKFHFVDL